MVRQTAYAWAASTQQPRRQGLHLPLRQPRRSTSPLSVLRSALSRGIALIVEASFDNRRADGVRRAPQRGSTTPPSSVARAVARHGR